MQTTPPYPFTFLGVFLLGLGLNLTPCVYPMLSITVSLFGSQKESGRMLAFLKALVYVLGMATMYSSLGVVAAFTGGFFGGLLQNRFVLLGMALLLAGLSLSMLGLYTFQIPTGFLSKVAGKRSVDFLGLFVSGLVVGIFAAPCIGPPVVALLAYAGTKGDPVFAFLLFFIMSLGLGLPYLVLGTFSGLMKKIPKSGVWLVWVERLFGIVLLTLAGFYLLLAVHPAGLQWLLPVAFSGGGLYLGFLEKSGTAKTSTFTRFKEIFGLAAILIAFAMIFLSPKQKVVWEPYSDSRLALARENRQPVIMDFYADWCIPCHELDRFTYSDPRVIEALAGFARLKVDMTNPDNPNTAAAMDKFEIVGVPTIIFLDSSGKEVPETRVTGFIPADDFMGLLESSVASAVKKTVSK